jgi:hypothetical protein
MMKGRALPVNQIKNFLKSAYEDNRANIDGYEYIKDLSNETTAVFYNPTLNKAVVSHRGTRGFLDWGNNIAYLKGVYKWTPRYRQGREAQRKAEQRYGRENVETLGHSQGAVLARELGRKTKNIIQVNPSYLFEKKGDNETIIRSSGDIVSRLSNPDITIPAQSSNPIEEHKLSILDRLPANRLVGRSILRKKRI